MANKPSEANFFPNVPVYPEMGTFQPVYGKFDLTTYIQGASDYEIMAFLVGKYNACLEAYGNITKLSTDTITACKQLQDWINSWFTNLDVQEELNKKIDSMVQDGSFGRLLHHTFDAQINQQTANVVTAWLVANVTPTGSAVVVDKSLTIEGAAADAKETGELKKDLVNKRDIRDNVVSEIKETTTSSLEFVKNSINLSNFESSNLVNISGYDKSIKKIVMLDCGRKYYSVSGIKSLIDNMALHNYNTLIMHFADNSGFRIESKKYPWLAGSWYENDMNYLTQDEVKSIVLYAKKYCINIIPELDMPGHFSYALMRYNLVNKKDLSAYYNYNGEEKLVEGLDSDDCGWVLDITNSDAITFSNNLIEEFGLFFRECGCTSFSIGGDEVLGYGTPINISVNRWEQMGSWENYAKNVLGNTNATSYDALVYFMNNLYHLLKSYDYEHIHLWADKDYFKYSCIQTYSKDIIFQYWQTQSPSNYLDSEYKIINFYSAYTYYIVGGNRPSPNDIKTNWNPYKFGDNVYSKISEEGNLIVGGGLCIWGDNQTAETETTVITNVTKLLQAQSTTFNKKGDS